MLPSTEDQTVTISATPAAQAAMAQAIAAHGPIMFHTSGGRVGGRNYPICLPVSELKLGCRDHLLGEINGTPIYDMEDREGRTRCVAASYVMDVEIGPTIGFSIVVEPGQRFTLREVLDPAEAPDRNDLSPSIVFRTIV